MEDLIQLAYAVDTFYFLVMGAMVMFMAPGFAMLEAGMVRSKNTSGILVKNVGLVLDRLHYVHFNRLRSDVRGRHDVKP